MNHQGVTQNPMNSIKIIQTQQPNICPSFKLNINFGANIGGGCPISQDTPLNINLN